MAGILSYFLPKDKVFYSLFEQASDNLEKIAKNLLQVVHEPDFNKRGVLIKEWKILSIKMMKLHIKYS